jgi:transposase
VEALKTLPLWRSQARLAAVRWRWLKARFSGDVAAFEALNSWWRKDRHLWEWESSQRVSSRRRRREIYRLFAAKLADEYKSVVFEKFDLRTMARRPVVGEDAESENETARGNRHLAATSELRLTVVGAFERRGGEALFAPAENTTRRCGSCGKIESFDQAAMVNHACSGCGATWDQDDNACTNLLAWYEQGRAERERERSGDAQEGEVARTSENASEIKDEKVSRWDRVKRLRKEKEERMATARDLGAK